jgi:peptidyl-prolyl cis-trans isomerase C
VVLLYHIFRLIFKMNSKIKVFCSTALVLCAALSSLTFAQNSAGASAAQSSKTIDLFPDEVVAKGDGVEIKRSQLDEAFVLVKANLLAGAQSYYIPEERRKVLEARLLDRLIATHLLLAKATDEDRKKAEETAKKFIDEVKSRTVSEDVFILQLKANGLTYEKFKTRVLEQSICDEVVQREVKAKVNITEDQIRKFYDDNPDEFNVPEIRKIAHLLISTRDMSDPAPQLRLKRELSDEQKQEKKKLAESILARAKKGDDFGKLVKEYSDDISSRERNGEYTITRAKDDPRAAMMPEIEVAAFSLGAGEVSDLINTPYGFHIIKVLEIKPAGKKPFSEVKDDIKKYLEQKEVQKLLPDYFDNLKKEAKVQILDPELREIQQQLSKKKEETN